jgi:hypothetical protein
MLKFMKKTLETISTSMMDYFLVIPPILGGFGAYRVRKWKVPEPVFIHKIILYSITFSLTTILAFPIAFILITFI